MFFLKKNKETTGKIRYTWAMKPFNFLAFSAFAGVFWLIMLFIFCFLLVHILLFAKAGWDAKRTKPPSQQAEKPVEPEKKQPEPIYYIVEKKKKRPKSAYSSPREIHFQ